MEGQPFKDKVHHKSIVLTFLSSSDTLTKKTPSSEGVSKSFIDPLL